MAIPDRPGWQDPGLCQPIGARDVWTGVGTTDDPPAPSGSVVLTPRTGDAATVGRAGLEAVFRSEYPRLVALARLLIDRQEEAEEIVQEAFVRAYAGWERIEQQHDPSAYVRRAVVNLARDALRRRATVRRAPVAAVGTSAAADVAALLSEDQRELTAALRALPERQRECVVLRYLLDLSTAATADALDIGEGSVKTHLSRGLAALEAALEDTR